jgi:predicted transcriptional regulator
MATTSLKLSEDIKQRVVKSSKNQGLSAHAFMINAISEAVTSAERKADFIAYANDSRDEAMHTGKGYDAKEVHEYIKTRMTQSEVDRPRAKHWQK